MDISLITSSQKYKIPYGVCEIYPDGKLKKITEKPKFNYFVNAGIYVLSAQLIKTVSRNMYLDMPDLLKKQIKDNQQVNMFPIHEYWLDIGRLDEYKRANEEIHNLSL